MASQEASSSIAETASNASSSAAADTYASQRDLERPFLKVPYELFNKTFRQSQKAVEKDLSVLEKAVHEISKKKNVSKEDACKYLDKFVQKLSGVKRKLEETDVLEQQQLYLCKARIEHLEQCPIQPSQALPEEHLKRFRADKSVWNKTRMNRILVDYLLRKGYYDAAAQLADSAAIKDFVDVDIFVKSSKVIEGLHKRDCTEALAWCAENKSKLKKMTSNLEFKLRVQEFVELIRNGKKHDAIQYARKQLTPLVNECEDKEQQTQWMHTVRQVMALLAFGSQTQIQCYRDYFDLQRWEQLVNDFQHDQFVLYSLTTRPMLHLTLQAGLSALKTPYAYQPDCYNVNDPLCNPQFQELAEKLPFSFHIHSKLVCRITGKVMDDRNPPMILPNGNVYSSQGIQELIAKGHDKKTFVDPRSGTTFDVSQLKKALII